MSLSGLTGFKLTRNQLIKAAFRIVGVYPAGSGEEPTSLEIQDASDTLNTILKSWIADGIQLWLLKQHNEDLVADKDMYTVGLTGDIDIPRPEKFSNIIFKENDNFQRPLEILARERYWALSDKLAKGVPVSAYYDPQLEFGRLFLWPVISTVDATTPEQIILIYQKPFDDVVDTADDFEIPQYYFNALKWALAVELGFEYGLPNDRLGFISNYARGEKKKAMDYDQEDASLFIQPSFRWYR